ncbi:hypothetical protein C8R45DRAFT_1070266 [Mycena sanguinolenta]|nr:hypothetical protein C8R45DRAFT_1070266 [Mycena sanguinolenta]
MHSSIPNGTEAGGWSVDCSTSASGKMDILEVYWVSRCTTLPTLPFWTTREKYILGRERSPSKGDGPELRYEKGMVTVETYTEQCETQKIEVKPSYKVLQTSQLPSREAQVPYRASPRMGVKRNEKRYIKPPLYVSSAACRKMLFDSEDAPPCMGADVEPHATSGESGLDMMKWTRAPSVRNGSSTSPQRAGAASINVSHFVRVDAPAIQNWPSNVNERQKKGPHSEYVRAEGGWGGVHHALHPRRCTGSAQERDSARAEGTPRETSWAGRTREDIYSEDGSRAAHVGPSTRHQARRRRNKVQSSPAVGVKSAGASKYPSSNGRHRDICYALNTKAQGVVAWREGEKERGGKEAKPLRGSQATRKQSSTRKPATKAGKGKTPKRKTQGTRTQSSSRMADKMKTQRTRQEREGGKRNAPPHRPPYTPVGPALVFVFRVRVLILVLHVRRTRFHCAAGRSDGRLVCGGDASRTHCECKVEDEAFMGERKKTKKTKAYPTASGVSHTVLDMPSTAHTMIFMS